jgi:uncharacterized protein YqgV (UPF0045/DUF77 family)
MELESILQVIIAAVGMLLFVSFFDLKRKLESMNKLEHIDTILEQLKDLVDRMQKLVTRQEVSENRFQIEIQYLKDRLHDLENRVDVVEKSGKL